ncbi:AzlC family ABC transporter permease [Silvimonas iriomotensis]|nr:AzlC family ABC transporter permease [Silvimonas iriomotensis]
MDHTASSVPVQRTEPAAGVWHGARDTLPMLVGAAPFGVIFGTLASTAGLPTWATMMMSLVVFGGSSQFVAVTLLASGASIPVIIATTFIVNLRHALYSATLMPHVQGIPKPLRACMAWFLTDETFAIVYHKIDSGEPVRIASYYMGSAAAMYSNWQFWTAVGIVIGQSVPGIAGWGLEFAMVATFVGIVVPLLKSRSQVAAALSAGAVAMLANGLPYKLGLMAAAFAGIAVGMAVATTEGKQS